ncbi:hypothetical protein Neosp_011541 [[Neocosmospora] mangrovei]
MGLLADLSLTRLCLVTVSVVIAGLGTCQFRRWHRLRHIPGPRGAGPLVRIGPNELLSTDPGVLRNMSAVRSTYTKGDFYMSGRIVPDVDNVVSERNEVKHKAMKAKMTPGYSGKENEGFGFEAGIDRQLLNFIALLDREYTSAPGETRPVDLAEKTQFFALDAIGDVSFGEPFGYLTQDEDLYHYNEINVSSLGAMNVVSVYPWLTKIVHRWPLKLLLPREGDQVGFGRLMGIAGSNSSAHALRMIILSIITNPPAHASLLAEIREHASSVSTPISWAQIQTLPYLRAVVREGLRMWPPLAGLGFKQVPPEGDTINGFFVPGGTQIGQGFHAVGRSRLIWGDDADMFRPERWLLAEESELRRMTAAWDTHFGHGKYVCLGKPIALMEIHKAVFELIKRYDFAIMNPEKPINIQASVFLFASDFWVRISRRNDQDVEEKK